MFLWNNTLLYVLIRLHWEEGTIVYGYRYKNNTFYAFEDPLTDFECCSIENFLWKLFYFIVYCKVHVLNLDSQRLQIQTFIKMKIASVKWVKVENGIQKNPNNFLFNKDIIFTNVQKKRKCQKWHILYVTKNIYIYIK